MSELREILQLWQEHGIDEDAVLATVVHVKGSAYRRPGARMLILGDGTRIGTISGGCLETDVVRKAWWWTEQGATIRVFDNSTEDAAWDFGLGCNGVITLLLERVNRCNTQSLLHFIAVQQQLAQASVIVTTIRTDDETDALGDHELFMHSHQADDDRIDLALRQAVQATFFERRSRLLHLPEKELFVEWLGPPQRLCIFGGGHDAIPLATMAAMLGWQVTIADNRSTYLKTDRFSHAEHLYLIPESGDIGPLAISKEDVVVVMTHNYPLDCLLLPQLLQRNPFYLGLLGPTSRAEKLFAELGMTPRASNLYAPIGMDIGGDHPVSIALSIASEIQAVLAKRSGGFLRQRIGPIHAPALEMGLHTNLPIADVKQRVMAICGI